MNRLSVLFGLCILTTGVFAQATTTTRVVNSKTKIVKASPVNILEKELPPVITGNLLNFVIEDDIMKQDNEDNQGDNETEESIFNSTPDDNTTIKESGQIAKTKQQALEESINIFPLPAKDYFNISIEKSSIEDLTLINANGKVVFNERNTNQQNVMRIDINQLAKGIYFVMLNTSNGRISKSIIIQ